MAHERPLSVETVREAARLAGVPIEEGEQEEVLAAFEAFLPALERLMALDLVDLEPAAIFRQREGASRG